MTFSMDERTRKFLEVFDLQDIDSLPKLKEIKAFGSNEYETTSSGEETSPEDESGKNDSEKEASHGTEN